MTHHNRERDDWLACIPNAHPGYISWERYQENLRLLAANAHGYQVARASPPREGPALLQGRAVCGRCGQYMSVRYRDARGKAESWYVCDRAHIQRAEPNCQSIAGGPIDEALELLLIEKMTPSAVELAVEIRKEIQTRYVDAQQLRDQALQRAQHEADLAQQRFMRVDPANRLVADSLESDWNDKLRALAAVREQGERARSQDDIEIHEAISNRLVTMCADFKQLWSDSSTPNRERKRMLAYLIEDVTLKKIPAEQRTKIHIRFRGGETVSLSAENPQPSWQKVQTPQTIVNLVDRLLDDHIYAEIADILNERGLQPGGAAWPGRGDTRFTVTRVRYIVKTYHLRSRFDRLRERGLLTRKELATRLQIHEQTLSQWVKRGIIKAHAYNGHAWLFEEPLTHPEKHSSRWDCLEKRAPATYASDTMQNP